MMLMHSVAISPIHPSFISHQTSSLYLRPIIQKPLPRTETTKFSTFLDLATATLGNIILIKFSSSIQRDEGWWYFLFPQIPAPDWALWGTSFDVFQGCGEDDQDPDLYKQFPCYCLQGLLLLQHAELMRLPRQGFIVPGKLGYLVSLVSSGRL